MLKQLFDFDRNEKDERFIRSAQSLDAFRQMLKQNDHHNDDIIYKLDLMAEGLIVALYELEQSLYIASELANDVTRKYADRMDHEEKKDYRLHVYFYKNALIRVFSTLDKLGHFINKAYRLETEKVKSNFSFFTVLRNMYHKQSYPDIQRKLYHWKKTFENPMNILRHQRNLEVHVINIDLQDDMEMLAKSLPARIHIEDIESNLANLNSGFEMVCRSVQTLFDETNELVAKTGRKPWI